MNKLFCFGFGYCAQRVAHRLTEQGWTVTGTATSKSGTQAIEEAGFRGLEFDGVTASPQVSLALQDATHVLLSIPPSADGDPAFALHRNDICRSRPIAWIGYFSTVGVYGDAQGGWVDEATPAVPVSERGQRRLNAEHVWRDLGNRTGKRVNIFRLPGIYGPGRSALDDVRAGTARRIVKPGQVFNRIHVDDIASTVIAALQIRRPDRIYNVTDDEPGPPQDVVAYAAQLLGIPAPPELDFATADLSPMARSFYGESKRVSNRRMKAELLPRLAYPTYREGLSAIAADVKK